MEVLNKSNVNFIRVSVFFKLAFNVWSVTGANVGMNANFESVTTHQFILASISLNYEI